MPPQHVHTCLLCSQTDFGWHVIEIPYCFVPKIKKKHITVSQFVIRNNFRRKHLLFTKSVQHINPFLHKCKLPKQEKYSSRMRTTRFPFCPQMSVLVGEHWPQVNKFEQVCSDGHKMSQAGLGLGITLPDVFGGGGELGMGPHA